MCAINGLFAYDYAADAIDLIELKKTRDYMAARGPDGAGLWVDDNARAAFGHRRLAIIDLSESGAQPMISSGGRTVVVFNGEIYNYRELRTQLERDGCVFQTQSDTEVLIHLYEAKGEAMVHDLRGMFAFAIWDATRSSLFLARDLYGIKPLYYSKSGGTFRFASQVKGLLAGGSVSRDTEPAGIVGFHLFGSVPEPYTIFSAIRALPAGHFMWVDQGGVGVPHVFASIAGELSAGAATPSAARELDEVVRVTVGESVRAHLVADVEVGVFLSAGIDSGALLGLMRDAGAKGVRAITLGFEDFAGTANDEAPLAAQVASLYEAEHTVRVVSKREFQAELPAILEAMDQPSIDGINTWFVAKATREAGLKVALSGVGGDELLAGYPSFRDVPRWARLMRWPNAIPHLGTVLRHVGTGLGFARTNPKLLGMVELGGGYPGAYLLRRGLFLPHELNSVLDPQMVKDGLAALQPLSHVEASMKPDPGSPISRVSALESGNYLRNQLLRDADWAGMAHSIEIRTPLVDIAVLRALAPSVARLTRGAGKRALAAAPRTPLPSSLVERSKSGFGTPMLNWMNFDPSSSNGSVSRQWSKRVSAHFDMPGLRPSLPKPFAIAQESAASS